MLSRENKRLGRMSKWLLIAGVWTLIALLFTGESLMHSYVAGRPLSLWRALSWELFSCYVWLAFLPLIFWLGRRFPFERGSRRRLLSDVPRTRIARFATRSQTGAIAIADYEDAAASAFFVQYAQYDF